MKTQSPHISTPETLTTDNENSLLSGTMKAVRIHEFGGVEKLIYENVPIPEPAPDELFIRVYAAGVNPVDWKIREGQRKNNIKLPLILGWDVAGIVIHKGILVPNFAEGDRVFARLDLTRDGAYSEYAIAKASEAAHAPSIYFDMAAGIPLASQTAWMGLFEVGKLKHNNKILIHGASGGVGMFAVQLAKIVGAYVVGTTSEGNFDVVKSLGANEVIDYKKEDFRKKVKDFDMVFDTIGGETQEHSWQVMHKGGTLVSTVGVDESMGTKFGMIGKSFMVNSNGARLEQIAGLIDKGLLRVIIEKEFPLNEVRKAHELSQSGKASGKIILRVYNEVEL
jgi:NADPH:quinone reductase-like Zn-dependent oxidoreductase